MEALVTLLQWIEKFLGPKASPFVLAVVIAIFLLIPVGAFHTLQSNQDAQASEISELKRQQIEAEVENKEMRSQIAWIYGFLKREQKQHSKEE